MQGVYAFPYRIGQFTPEYCKTPELQKAWLDEHLSQSRQVAELDGVPLYVLRKDAKKSILFTPSTDKTLILYVMELHKLAVDAGSLVLPDVLRKRANYQGSVWRQAALQHTHASLAADVFKKFLISTTRNVVSDACQSNDGEAFWIRRVKEALGDASFAVYGLKCEATGGTLLIEQAKRLTESTQMNEYYTDGEDYAGYYRRIAITKI